MDKPLISIIMNCYNGEKYLKETLQSVYAQTYTNWEVIFWDNLSIDNSKNIACSFDKKVKYFKGDYFLPLGAARNMAISKARGEYIAILDCDDLWYPEKLSKQLEIFDKFPEIDLVYSDYALLNKDKIKYSNNNKLNLAHKCNAFESLFLHKLSIPWPTIIMKKSAVNNVGGFAKYKSVEDFDLLLKMAEKGIFFFIDEVLAIYRIHSNQLSSNFDLAKKEIFQVYNFWENKWVDNGSYDKQKKEWLEKGKNKICYITGLRALIQNKPASSYFKEAYKYNRGIKLFLLFIVSYISPITLLIRKYYFERK
jgi:glycosyltransferase involved in cell wall biosynthesis